MAPLIAEQSGRCQHGAMDRHVVEQRPEVQHLLERVSSDDNVRGLVLTGSWAREMATQHSDIDIYVVVESAQGWVTTRSKQIDLPVCSMADLRALPVEPSQWWNRYSFVDAQLLLDRTAGELDALVHAWATLNAAEVDRCLETYLDGYINFAYPLTEGGARGQEGRTTTRCRRVDRLDVVGRLCGVRSRAAVQQSTFATSCSAARSTEPAGRSLT